MANLKCPTVLRFSAPNSPFNPLCNGLRRFRVAPVALLLAMGVGWSAPAASAQAVNFGSVNVCPSGATTPAPCNKTLAVSFTVPASGTLGTPKVFTQGAPNLDFTLASGSTCVGAVTEGATCAVNVTFAPIAPGERNGGVQLVDGSGNFLANAYIYGTGVGPQLTFQPGTQTAIGTDFIEVNGGWAAPWGLAVDASGNVFVVNADYGQVVEILAAGGYSTVNILTTIGEPVGIAVDGSGNVFLTSGFSPDVMEILAVNGSIPAHPTITTLGSGFNGQIGIALDGSGNVFVADGISAVKEILATGGYTTINTLASGFNQPLGVAVDGNGNVFVADTNNGRVKQIAAVGGSIPANPTIRTLASGYSGPSGVTVDAGGDVYFTTGSNEVHEIMAVDGSIPASPTINTLGSGNYGVGLDASGNVYSDEGWDGGMVERLDLADPPTLTFGSTSVGATSLMQSVQIQNVGNATLSLSGLSVSGDFSLVAGSGTPADCTASSSLRPGARCNLSISFTPEADGALAGALTLSDNALNGNPTQTIQLSGTGQPPSQAKVSSTLQFDATAFGTTETLPLTITNIGLGTLTVSASISGPSYIISGSTCGAGVTAGNSCTLQVQFSPVTIGSHVDILTLQTNGLTNPIVTLHGKAYGVGVKTEGPLEFGTIAFGSTKVLPLTITNIGTPGTITVGTKIGGPSYKVLTNAQNTCLAGIAAGQSCTLPIEFDPVSVGMHDDILTLFPSGATNAPSTQHLDGVAN
jgi:hypothetical protein